MSKDKKKKEVFYESREKVLDKKNRKTRAKSEKHSVTQKNDFIPKETDPTKDDSNILSGSKTVPDPSLLEREDFSYKINNKLTREEIQGYEEHIQMSRMSGEQFVRFISTPLRKKSAIELRLSEKKAQGFFLKKLSVEELMSEKNKVKNELKYYDKVFINKVGKPPSNREKEPLK